MGEAVEVLFEQVPVLAYSRPGGHFVAHSDIMNKTGLPAPPRDAMTEEDLNQIRSIVSAELTARLDRFAEAIIGNISDFRQEMNARFAHVGQRFDTVERRLERVE